MGRDIDVSWFIVHCVDAALEDAEEFNFLELLLLLFSCFYLIEELHFWVLVNRVYFIKIRANTTMLLGPDLNHLQDILALLRISVG